MRFTSIFSRRSLLLAACAVILIGIYTNLPLQVGGIRIPAALAVAMLPPLMAAHAGWRLGRYPLWCLLLLVMSLITAMAQVDFGAERVASFVGLVVSVLLCRAVYQSAVEIGPNRWRTLLAAVFCVALAGAAAEVLIEPVRALSDTVRTALYSDLWLYADADRDMFLHGGLRPMLFSQEPSHLAKLLAFTGVGLFALSRGGLRWATIGGILVAIVVTRSPTAAMALPLLGLVILVERGGLRLLPTVGLGIATAATVGIVWYLAQVGENRVAEIAAGADTSFLMRGPGAYRVAVTSWADYPWFGVGLGGKELLRPYVLDIYGSAGANLNPYWHSVESAITNAGAEFLAYYGILGSILAAVTLAGLLPAMFPPFVWAAYAAFVLTIQDGNWNAPRTWAYLAIFMASLELGRHQAGNSSVR